MALCGALDLAVSGTLVAASAAHLQASLVLKQVALADHSDRTMSQCQPLVDSNSWLSCCPSLLGPHRSAFEGRLNSLFGAALTSQCVRSLWARDMVQRQRAVSFTSRMTSPIVHTIGFMWFYVTAQNRRVELHEA